MDNWCTIESDPGVFTELIEDIGVKGVQVEELYTIDEESFSELGEIYGLIFLFKWEAKEDTRSVLDAKSVPDLFFSRQMISNACATQAILSVLLNCDDKLDIGDLLQDFKDFSRDFEPEMRGLAVSNCETIRKVHNSFASQDSFLQEKIEDRENSDQDAFHFVAYVPHKNKVYELDGLKHGPILLGEGSDWIKIVTPELQKRMLEHGPYEIRFNLLAVVRNRAEAAKEKIIEFNALRNDAEMKIANGDIDPELEQLQAQYTMLIEQQEQEIESEKRKFEIWRLENKRRKHNYLPFTMALLRILAKEGHLKHLIDLSKDQSTLSSRKQKRNATAAGLEKK